MITIAKSNLVDEESPQLDLRSSVNSSWAYGLFTLRQSGREESSQIRFDFGTNVSLSAVKLELFNCPAWGIGPANISVFTDDPSLGSNVSKIVGSLDASSMPSSCHKIVPVHIPINTNVTSEPYQYYYVGFDYLSQPAVGEGGGAWVSIAEVGFKPIPRHNSTVIRCRS